MKRQRTDILLRCNKRSKSLTHACSVLSCLLAPSVESERNVQLPFEFSIQGQQNEESYLLL